MSPSSTSNSETLAANGLIALCPDALATPGRRWLGRAVIVWFFALTGGTAALDRLWPYAPVPLIGIDRVEDDRRHHEASIREGVAMKLWEADLKRTSRTGALALPPYATLRYRIFRSTESGTLCGPRGWLFSRDRARLRDADLDTMPERVATALAAVERRLGSLGVDQLVLMLLPRKEVIHNDQLPPGIDVVPRLDEEMQAAVVRRGMVSPDLLALARREPAIFTYAMTDTHWEDSAAVAAAHEAVRVAGLGVADPATRPKLRDCGVFFGPGDIARGSGMVRDDRWDPLGAGEGRQMLRVDAPEALGHHDVLTGTAPIALVGTSFSTVLPMDSYLSRQTGLPVRNGATPARGVVAPMRDVIEQGRAVGMPRVIFWELPEHFLLGIPAPQFQFQELLAGLPQPRVAPVHFAGVAPECLALFKGGSLRPGRQSFAEPWTATYLTTGAIVHPGNGMVGVTLHGAVTRGAVRVVVRCGNESASMVWTPGASECFVGAVTTQPSSDLLLAINCETPDTAFDLTGAEVSSDVDWDHATQLEIKPPAAAAAGWIEEMSLPAPLVVPRNAAAAFLLKGAGGPLRTLTVEAVLADGSTRSILAPPAPGPECALFVGLNVVAGQRVTGFRLTGAGGTPRAAVVAASYAPQLRA